MEKAVTSFDRGLVIVNDSLSQPTNSYPFALNGLKDNIVATPSVISNEPGFDRYLNLLATNDIVLGYQSLDDKSFVVFIQNDASSPKSKICLLKDSANDEFSGVLSTIYSNDDLNFNRLYPVRAEYKINYKGDRIVYFTDDYNPVRSINIDDVTDYTANIGSFSPTYSAPIITTDVSDTGGSLKTGAYQFFIAYKQNDVLTSYTSLTDADYILKSPQSETSKPNQEKAGSESNLPTSKSIDLSLTNLDSNFTKIALGVIITIEGSSVPYIIKNELRYSGTTLSYKFTGSETLTSLTDINAVLVDQPIINTAAILTQKDNRLLLGNIKYQNNVLNYQSYANNIQVTWYESDYEGNADDVSIRVGNSVTNKFDTQDKNVTKQFKTSFNADVPMSFMRDEVYALGIQWELKSGGYTPVYHIPGRALNKKADGTNFSSADGNPEISSNYTTWDSQLNVITEYPSESRWKVFNTASDNGDLAYYESEEVYPSGYGFPTTGSSVNGDGTTKVRHHKMPDGRLSPIITHVKNVATYRTCTSTRKYLGLNFANIEIPAELLDLVNGFRIMIVPRDNNINKSILGKGIFQNIFVCDLDGETNGHVPKKYNNYDTSDDDSDLTDDNTGSPRREKRLKAFYSPDLLFETPTLSASKLSVESMTSGVPYYIYANTADTGVLEYASAVMLNQMDAVSRGSGIIQSSIDDAVYIGYSQIQSDLGDINTISKFYNTDRQALVLLQTEYDIENGDDITDANTVDNLDDTNLTHFLYGSIKQNNPNQYGGILDLVYIPTSLYVKDLTVDGSDLITATVQGLVGDSYIEMFTRKHTHSKYKTYMTEAPEVFVGVMAYFVETQLNIRYRLAGTDFANTPFPQGVYLNNNEPYSYMELVYGQPELFTLNPDYNLGYTNKVYEGYSTKLVDIDSELRYSTRILYSDKDNFESITDQYRIFRANNYRDLPKNKGKLTSFFTKEELLYGTTVDSLWMLQTNQQQLKTNTDASVFVGTGEFLSIEPKEVLTIQSGYLGVNTPLCISQSPYGTLLVDSERGSIFLFQGGKAQDITISGLQTWFMDNKNISLSKYGLTNLNPHDPKGAGYLTAYDSEKARFLITKRDYDFIDPTKFKGTTDDIDALIEATNLSINDILLDVDNQVFKKVTGLSPTVLSSALNYTDNTIFYNKGFTLSYSLLNQSFISFHSYIPTNYFEVRDRLFSRDVSDSTGTLTEQGIYRHNKGIYGRYYTSDIKPFIVEVSLNAGNPYTKVFDSFAVESYATSNDDTYNSKVIYDLCFDKVVLYNDFQCSGEITLDDSTIKRSERLWRFNNFKDLTVDSSLPIWVTDPAEFSSSYFIDKVINADRIDSAKPWYEKARFRDKYINARFTLNNLDNKKFLCTFVSSNYRVSYR